MTVAHSGEGKRDTCRRHWTPTKTTYMTDSVRRTENRAKTGSARWTPLPRGLFINYGRISHNGVSGLGCLLMNRVIDGPLDYVFCRKLISRLHFFLSPLFQNSNLNLSKVSQIIEITHALFWRFSKYTRDTNIDRVFRYRNLCLSLARVHGSIINILAGVSHRKRIIEALCDNVGRESPLKGCETRFRDSDIASPSPLDLSDRYYSMNVIN